MIRRPPRSTLFPTRRSSDLPFYSWLVGFSFTFCEVLNSNNCVISRVTLNRYIDLLVKKDSLRWHKFLLGVSFIETSCGAYSIFLTLKFTGSGIVTASYCVLFVLCAFYPWLFSTSVLNYWVWTKVAKNTGEVSETGLFYAIRDSGDLLFLWEKELSNLANHYVWVLWPEYVWSNRLFFKGCFCWA